MMISFSYVRRVLELAKNDDHFCLFIPVPLLATRQQKVPYGSGCSIANSTSIATRRCCVRPSTWVAFARPLIAAPKEACSWGRRGT